VGARFGVKSVRGGIDFAAVNAHVRHAIETVAPQIRANALPASAYASFRRRAL